jgi:integrase
MTDEPRVWIRSRARTNGELTFDLRWQDPTTGRWQSKWASDDRAKAEKLATRLEIQLEDGTYKAGTRIKWAAFVADHCSKLPGATHAKAIGYTLADFGKVTGVSGPAAVTFGMVEQYVAALRRKDNGVSTIDKRLRHLRNALKMAVRRGMATKNPMDDWTLEPLEETEPREITPAEESRLLQAAEDLKGEQWRAFIFVSLRVGTRRSELLGLQWSELDLDGGMMRLLRTKGKRPRRIPLNADTVAVLRRVRLMTMKDPGPFAGLVKGVGHHWETIRERAGLPGVKMHHFRSTFTSRLLRAGVDLDTVIKLVGHASAVTTLKHYAASSDTELRAGVAKLASAG